MDGLPRLTSICSETGRSSQSESSVEALRGRDGKWMPVPGRRGSTAGRHDAELKTLTSSSHALLRSASGEFFPA
jgi:hypothetical protein